MKNVAAGALFVAAIIMANVVAAGVISLLAMAVKGSGTWAEGETWPWAIISLIGIVCAIAFLRGAIEMLAAAGGFKGKRHVANR